jgi:hypothetical protein
MQGANSQWQGIGWPVTGHKAHRLLAGTRCRANPDADEAVVLAPCFVSSLDNLRLHANLSGVRARTQRCGRQQDQRAIESRLDGVSPYRAGQSAIRNPQSAIRNPHMTLSQNYYIL